MTSPFSSTPNYKMIMFESFNEAVQASEHVLFSVTNRETALSILASAIFKAKID